MPVKQRKADVTEGYGCVEDLQELGPDIAGHPGIPRRVKPPDLSLPAPALFLFVVVVERVNIFLLIFKIKGVTAGFDFD